MRAMIGSAILAVMNIIMYKTKPITRLRSFCAIWEWVIGSVATEKVLQDVESPIHEKKIHRKFKKHWTLQLTEELTTPD
jgi:hypothetical protein